MSAIARGNSIETMYSKGFADAAARSESEGFAKISKVAKGQRLVEFRSKGRVVR